MYPCVSLYIAQMSDFVEFFARRLLANRRHLFIGVSNILKRDAL
jgi:hypothetical protein